jgi:hypothetical protein
MRTQTFMMLFAAGSLAVGGAANAEPCNPIIDGTYCATQMPKKTVSSTPSSNSLRPLQDTSHLVSTNGLSGSQPGTLVGISFQGSGSCFGLLRRSVCN